MTHTQPTRQARILAKALDEIGELYGTRALMERAQRIRQLAENSPKQEKRFDLAVAHAIEDVAIEYLPIKRIGPKAPPIMLWDSGYYISRQGKQWKVNVIINGHGVRDFRMRLKREDLLRDIATLHLKYDLPIFEIESTAKDSR